MVLTIDVSPAGTHSVSIVASNVGNDTVTYIITDTKPEGKRPITGNTHYTANSTC